MSCTLSKFTKKKMVFHLDNYVGSTINDTSLNRCLLLPNISLNWSSWTVLKKEIHQSKCDSQFSGMSTKRRNRFLLVSRPTGTRWKLLFQFKNWRMQKSVFRHLSHYFNTNPTTEGLGRRSLRSDQSKGARLH